MVKRGNKKKGETKKNKGETNGRKNKNLAHQR
jgi:hypothetical protein